MKILTLKSRSNKIFQESGRDLHPLKGIWNQVGSHNPQLILTTSPCLDDFKNLFSSQVQTKIYIYNIYIFLLRNLGNIIGTS